MHGGGRGAWRAQRIAVVRLVRRTHALAGDTVTCEEAVSGRWPARVNVCWMRGRLTWHEAGCLSAWQATRAAHARLPCGRAARLQATFEAAVRTLREGCVTVAAARRGHRPTCHARCGRPVWHWHGATPTAAVRQTLARGRRTVLVPPESVTGAGRMAAWPHWRRGVGQSANAARQRLARLVAQMTTITNQPTRRRHVRRSKCWPTERSISGRMQHAFVSIGLLL